MTINEINNILGEPDYTEATGATDLGGYLYAYPIGEKLNGEYEVDFKVTTWRENGSTHEGLILWNAYWW